MKHIRRRKPSESLSVVRLAADARISQTSYTDDQVWDVFLGQPSDVALSLMTHYGGRRHAAKLAFVITTGEQTRYLTKDFHTPPFVIHKTPSFCAIQCEPTPDIHVTIQFACVASHAWVGHVSVTNQASQPLAVDIGLYFYLEPFGKPRVIAESPHLGLTLGEKEDIVPVFIMQGASLLTQDRAAAPLTVEPNETAVLSMAHCGMADAQQGFIAASAWLKTPWADITAALDAANHHLPQAPRADTQSTAVEELFTALAQSVISPHGHLKHAFIVHPREPDRGYSARGDGADYGRHWGIQDPYVIGVVAPALATFAPHIAHGLVENFLEHQQPDGSIGMEIAPYAFNQELLCPPIMAGIAEQIYQVTADEPFRARVLPRLQAFVGHWLDMLPHALAWQAERQTNFVYADDQVSRQQGVVMHNLLAPDLLLYLLRELEALAALGSKTKYTRERKQLTAGLQSLWTGEYYAVLDRDTRDTGSSQELFDGKVTEAFTPSTLAKPARLAVRIVNIERATPATLRLTGSDASGSPVTERLDAKRFEHHTAVTDYAYAHLESVTFENLSRVYAARIFSVSLEKCRLYAPPPEKALPSLADTVRGIWLKGRNTHPLWQPELLRLITGLPLIASPQRALVPASALAIQPLDLVQHGVQLKVNSKSAGLKFPSRTVVRLEAGDLPTVATDGPPKPFVPPPAIPVPSTSQPRASRRRVTIDVDISS
jgi:hypothetical protein